MRLNDSDLHRRTNMQDRTRSVDARNPKSRDSGNHNAAATIGADALDQGKPELNAASVPRSAKSKSLSEPLTISLKSDLLRKARILAASKSITVSRLIAGILADTVARELPAVVADLQGTEEGDDQ